MHNPARPVASPTTACRAVLRRQGLQGAQLGRTLVLLKYYHGDKLLRSMETLHRTVTLVTTAVRGFVARRKVTLIC